MFYTSAFYIASLAFWTLGLFAWRKDTWLNIVIKMACGAMAVWSLILVLQTYVPMR